MHKFDKISIKEIFFCSLDAYLIVIITYLSFCVLQRPMRNAVEILSNL